MDSSEIPLLIVFSNSSCILSSSSETTLILTVFFLASCWLCAFILLANSSARLTDPLFQDPSAADYSLKPGPSFDRKQGLTDPQAIRKLLERWKTEAKL